MKDSCTSDAILSNVGIKIDYTEHIPMNGKINKTLFLNHLRKTRLKFEYNMVRKNMLFATKKM